MSGLDAAIRERLATAQELESCGDPVTVLTYSVLVETIEAVLDLHKPMVGWHDGESVCTCLPDCDDTYMAHDYPCPTMRAIAEKLGVEVDG